MQPAVELVVDVIELILQRECIDDTDCLALRRLLQLRTLSRRWNMAATRMLLRAPPLVHLPLDDLGRTLPEWACRRIARVERHRIIRGMSLPCEVMSDWLVRLDSMPESHRILSLDGISGSSFLKMRRLLPLFGRIQHLGLVDISCEELEALSSSEQFAGFFHRLPSLWLSGDRMRTDGRRLTLPKLSSMKRFAMSYCFMTTDWSIDWVLYDLLKRDDSTQIEELVLCSRAGIPRSAIIHADFYRQMNLIGSLRELRVLKLVHDGHESIILMLPDVLSALSHLTCLVLTNWKGVVTNFADTHFFPSIQHLFVCTGGDLPASYEARAPNVRYRDAFNCPHCDPARHFV